MKIKLEDLLKIPHPYQTKVKFNMNASDPRKKALDFLLEDSEEWLIMNEWKTTQASNNIGERSYLISFAQYYPYGPEFFLFGGIYKVELREGSKDNKEPHRGYKLKPTNLYKEYEKRLIIKLNKPIGRDIYLRNYENIFDSLKPEVYEITQTSTLDVFKGYDTVSLTHKELTNIYNNNEPNWKQALSHIKAVYVITDTKTGKLYIGSASGNNEGLWQRWRSYANPYDQTGGNKDFIRLIDTYGIDYIKDNFKYSDGSI